MLIDQRKEAYRKSGGLIIEEERARLKKEQQE